MMYTYRILQTGALSMILANLGCSSIPTNAQRSIAGLPFKNNCAELASRMPDRKALESVGCTAEGKAKDLFEVVSDWVPGEYSRLNEIETKALIMAAINQGFKTCKETFEFCLIRSISLKETAIAPTSQGRLLVSRYGITIQGVDTFVKRSEVKPYSDQTQIGGAQSIPTVLSLHSQYEVLASTLKQCYSDGFIICPVINFGIAETTHWPNIKFQVTASASILGANFGRAQHGPTKAPELSFDFDMPVPAESFDRDIRPADL